MLHAIVILRRFLSASKLLIATHHLHKFILKYRPLNCGTWLNSLILAHELLHEWVLVFHHHALILLMLNRRHVVPALRLWRNELRIIIQRLVVLAQEIVLKVLLVIPTTGQLNSTELVSLSVFNSDVLALVVPNIRLVLALSFCLVGLIFS